MRPYSRYELFVLEKPMVKCADFEKLLGEYVDGEVPPTLHARLHSHASVCPVCNSSLESYNFVIASARMLGNQPLPEGAQQRLRARLNERLGLSMPLD